MTPADFSCPICCCEDLPIGAKCVLTRCSHECCKACLKKVIQSGGQQPLCPFCRTKVAKKDIRKIQRGRPIQPITNSTSEDEIDDHTRNWLQENTRPYPRCGLRIEQEDGCNEMECLCGCSFCFSCGSEGANCGCDSISQTSAEPRTPRTNRTTPESRRAFLRRLFERSSQPGALAAAAAAAAAVAATTTLDHGSEMGDIDEGTRQWLQENTRECPSCGSHIERTNECNQMACLCGCAFCFSCGSQSQHCSCDRFDFLWDHLDPEMDGRVPFGEMIDASPFLGSDDDGEDDLQELMLEQANNTLVLEHAQNTNALANILERYQQGMVQEPRARNQQDRPHRQRRTPRPRRDGWRGRQRMQRETQRQNEGNGEGGSPYRRPRRQRQRQQSRRVESQVTADSGPAILYARWLETTTPHAQGNQDAEEPAARG